MTPEQFEAEMREIATKYGGDIEGAHSMADGLMANVLCKLGYSAGIDVYQDMDKWYA
jgi:hypothetical protein